MQPPVLLDPTALRPAIEISAEVREKIQNRLGACLPFIPTDLYTLLKEIPADNINVYNSYMVRLPDALVDFNRSYSALVQIHDEIFPLLLSYRSDDFGKLYTKFVQRKALNGKLQRLFHSRVYHLDLFLCRQQESV